MTTVNWRTNLGGAIRVTGTGMAGIGTLSQLTQLSPNTANIMSPHQLAAMWYVALVGFVLSCIGGGVTALFAADAKELAKSHEELSAKLEDLKAEVHGDTTKFSNQNTVNETKN